MRSGRRPRGDDGTRLFDGACRALADIPPERIAGAILVTDGQVHDVPEASRCAAIRGPLHVLLTGERTRATAGSW